MWGPGIRILGWIEFWLCLAAEFVHTVTMLSFLFLLWMGALGSCFFGWVGGHCAVLVVYFEGERWVVD